MGLEFKPYFSWEEEDHDRCVGKCGDGEKHATSTAAVESGVDSDEGESLSGHGVTTVSEQQRGSGPPPVAPAVGLVFVHADGTPAVPGAPVGAGSRELVASLAAVNLENREYAVLLASEEDNVNEYKSFFSIVLDYPQFLGQGETKDSALRQASRLLHYALGSMVLKNETIPAPSSGAELEAKKATMERDWLLVKLENFSMEIVPLQFQPGIDYLARPPESDGEYESDHEDEELFELESRMSTP